MDRGVAVDRRGAHRTRRLSFIADRDRRWFSVVGLDRLCDALFANVHTGVRITETEIERMAALHGLKERKNYAGFLWPGTLTAPNPPLFRDPPTYRGSVGRRAEMDEMTRALNGKASVLTLIGVPGAGKTHLAAGAAELLTRSGRTVWWIDCGPTRSCEVSLETLLLALAHQMPSTVDRQLVADRDQPLAGRIDKALDWCDAAKLVLVLDDYDELRPDHGLDLLIQQVDQCCHAAQVVVASSHRPDYLSDPVHSLGGAYTVAVGGLGRDDVIEYLKVRSARNLLHLDLRRADPQVIWEGTGGIPVSLDRLAQLSANRSPDKVLRDAGGGEWEETARKLFEEVLNSVSPQARELAAAASVVRRGLDADFVLALAEPGAGQPLLNELVDASVLTGVDDRGFVLAGGLRQHLGDVLDDAPGLRATAHRRATAHLLDLAARPGSDSFAHEEEALRHAAEAGEWEVLLQRAPAVVETLSHRGEYARALDQARTAQGAAESLSRTREIAYWQIEQGAILRHAGNAEESERLCRTGLEAAEALADSGLKARAYHVLGSLALAHGDHEAARGYCEAALELDRRLEDRAHEAASLARLAGLEMRQGRADRAEDLYRESLALAEQGGEDPAELARRHFDLSLVQKYDGKLDDALAPPGTGAGLRGKDRKTRPDGRDPRAVGGGEEPARAARRSAPRPGGKPGAARRAARPAQGADHAGHPSRHLCRGGRCGRGCGGAGTVRG